MSLLSHDQQDLQRGKQEYSSQRRSSQRRIHVCQCRGGVLLWGKIIRCYYTYYTGSALHTASLVLEIRPMLTHDSLKEWWKTFVFMSKYSHRAKHCLFSPHSKPSSSSTTRSRRRQIPVWAAGGRSTTFPWNLSGQWCWYHRTGCQSLWTNWKNT